MTERRKPTTLDKLRIMVRQAVCPLCGKKLGALEDTQFDHETALVNEGEDTLENLRAVHVQCHKVKTFGPGGEKRITTAGSDIGIRDKTKRLVAKRQAREAAAANLIEANSDIEPKSVIAKSGKSVNSKPKRKIQGRSSWPPKKPKVPYRRRGV